MGAAVLVLSSLILAGVSLIAQPPSGSPADRWVQFRGTPALHGTSAAALPATLKVLWTYEAGDAIESSAAIAEGGVSRSQTGDLHEVNLADGTRKESGRRPTVSASPRCGGAGCVLGDGSVATRAGASVKAA